MYNFEKQSLKKLPCHGLFLQVLMDAVDTMSQRRVTALSDAMLLLECVSCVKHVLNSKIGLEYLIEQQEYTRKLARGEFMNPKGYFI